MPDPWGAFYSNDDMDDDNIKPKLQGDPEGEKSVRGILRGIFLGLAIWTVGIMIWWAWIS